MSGFKLIAIRPLVGCDNKFVKNLQVGTIYKFYNDYDFYDNEGKKIDNLNSTITLENGEIIDNKISSISFNLPIQENLYKIKNKKNKDISVNISAIVGNNGSGKSAISELLLYSLFIISNKLRFVFKSSFLENEFEELRYKSEFEIIKGKLCLELFYSIDDNLFNIKILSNNIYLQKIKYQNNIFKVKQEWEAVTKRSDLYPFFYTMTINYSMYAFNSNQIGMWIKGFFHKNDGYQMPVVINPYRNEGIIDVNNETYLTRSRLLANIISIENYRQINSKLTVKSIELNRDERKYNKYFFLEDKRNIRFSKTFINKFRDRIIKKLYDEMFSYKIRGKITKAIYPDFNNTNQSDIRSIVEIYLINKIITIPTRYKTFEKYDCRFDKLKSIEDNFDLSDIRIEGYINDLFVDRSHVTLKIRQSLNFLRKNIFELPFLESKIEIDLDNMVEKINDEKKEYLFTELVDYIPPPVFFSEIIFNDGSKFTQLSSGEKQNIFTLNSLIYHIQNIDSVHYSVTSYKRLVKYNNVNIIFDEIELYFHPEYQQRFIDELLRLIKNSNLKEINSINILFLTHSPFILSDIPCSNILKLKNGIPELYNEKEQTFGANINDILANEFFLIKGFMGEFAKSEINNVINSLNYKYLINSRDEKQNLLNSNDENIDLLKEDITSINNKLSEWKKPSAKYNKEFSKSVINIIGEPLLKYKLEELYYSAYPEQQNKELAKKQIIELAKRSGLEIKFDV